MLTPPTSSHQVLLAWVLSNGGLVAAILSTSAGNASPQNVYMAFLLYSVAVLAAVRFLGSTAYSIMWLFQVRARPSLLVVSRRR